MDFMSFPHLNSIIFFFCSSQTTPYPHFLHELYFSVILIQTKKLMVIV